MQDKTKPSYESAAYRAMKDDLILCRHVAAGTSVIREERENYLPKHPAEDRADYGVRLQRSVMFAAFPRTVRGLAGMRCVPAYRQGPGGHGVQTRP
jgi:hypothetical protein